MTMDEFDDIKVKLDGAELPAGETMILQVRPDWWRLALGAFHLKAIGVYFLVFALWRLGATYHDTGSTARSVGAVAELLPSFGIGICLVMGLAYLTARATSFTITDRRVVMRYGVALPAQVNIPLKDVDAAGVRVFSDGAADIPLTLPKGGPGRPSYFQLWPYVKPLGVVSAQPMLRAVPDGAKVADVLARTLMAHQGGQRSAVPVATPRPKISGGVPAHG